MDAMNGLDALIKGNNKRPARPLCSADVFYY